MGKGFNNYMTKKFFHPSSKENIKRVWMAQQKTDFEKKKQEDLLNQYQKEQEVYANRALLGDEKAKHGLSFMYDAPPGLKKKEDEPDGEVEVKFEWQRKFNAPREQYAKNDDEIRDQPFGIEVRNVRCIKCRKWGHVNTDKICPLFNKDLAEEPTQPSTSAASLLEGMKEDGFKLKESILGRMANDPTAEHEKILDSEDEDDPEVKFLKSLSAKQKKKLLKKLNKLQDGKGKKSKKEKKHKKKQRSSSDSEDHEHKRAKKKKRKQDSESESETNTEKKRKHRDRYNTDEYSKRKQKAERYSSSPDKRTSKGQKNERSRKQREESTSDSDSDSSSGNEKYTKESRNERSYNDRSRDRNQRSRSPFDKRSQEQRPSKSHRSRSRDRYRKSRSNERSKFRDSRSRSRSPNRPQRQRQRSRSDSRDRYRKSRSEYYQRSHESRSRSRSRSRDRQQSSHSRHGGRSSINTPPVKGWLPSAKVTPGARDRGSRTSIWIVGSSIVFWAHKRASQQRNINLDIKTSDASIEWYGTRGMRWNALLPKLHELVQSKPPPDVLLLYVGSNDVGYVKPTDLVKMMKTDLSTIKEMCPNTSVIYNEILSRINWRGAPSNEEGEEQRVCINKLLKPVLQSMGDSMLRHSDIRNINRSLYRDDGVHLNDAGYDIFNGNMGDKIRTVLSEMK